MSKMSSKNVTTRRTHVTTSIGTLEVRGLIDGADESLLLKPLGLQRAGFTLSREAIIDLHRVLGGWIDGGNDALENDFQLAC
jgi:hypothetical protein